MGLQLNRIDCLGMQSPDETKFFDARNSAETELSYGLKPSSPSWGQALNLVRLVPRLALAGAFLDGECRSTSIPLDFIFRLRAGLTPSPTNDCKKAALAPPSAHHQGGKHADQNRRCSDALLRQRVLCGSCSRGHNSACLTAAPAAAVEWLVRPGK
jgi:hypothetical protein